jgi:hypothetical protein
MTRIYLIILVCTIITGAYFYGKSVGVSKCEKQYFQNQIKTTEQQKTNERIINATVYKTGVGDIRRILRDKYTIAE